MSIYEEIPSSTIKEVSGKKYNVRKFGMNGVVYEEKLYPLPLERTIRMMKADGTEDVTKRKTEALPKPPPLPGE